MRLPRYAFDCELTLTVYRSGQKQELWGRAADISEGGVAATLSETLEVGGDRVDSSRDRKEDIEPARGGALSPRSFLWVRIPGTVGPSARSHQIAL